jgi:hypothetical protein
LTDLIIKEDQMSVVDLAASLGASVSSKEKFSIDPMLKHNYVGENGPMGSFFLKMSKEQDQVYAVDGVKFRAFSSHVQWIHWRDSEVVNQSTLVLKKNTPSGKLTEARDILGGLNCGLPDYDEFWALSEEERLKLEGRDYYRVIRGLVSYTGKTPSGEEKTITNQPCIFKGKKENYGKFWKDFVSNMPAGSNIWDFESTLVKETKISKQKKNYYITRFTPDFSSPLAMDQMTYDSLSYVSKAIKDENERIEKKYKEATFAKVDGELQDEALAQIEAADAALEKDFA